ncbi:hypothetical protein [Oceanobacillus sp. FSL H7-0719]
MKKLLIASVCFIGLLAGCSGDIATVKDSSGNNQKIATYNYTDQKQVVST